MIKLNVDLNDIQKEFNQVDDQNRDNNKPAEIKVNLLSEFNGSLDSAIIDATSQWYLNSRVFDGRFLRSPKELAQYLSKKFKVPIDPSEIMQNKEEVQKTIRRGLSDADKVELVQAQLSYILQQAQCDRGKAVAVLDKLTKALDNLIERFGGDDAALEEAFTSKAGRSLIFFVQSQQKLAYEANDRVLSVMDRMLNFGSTKETSLAINGLLNTTNSDERPLTTKEVLELIAANTQNPLPTVATQLNLEYDTFDKEDENGDPDHITIEAEVQTELQPEPECSSGSNECSPESYGFTD